MITQVDLLLDSQRAAEKRLSGLLIANPLALDYVDGLKPDTLVEERVKKFWQAIITNRAQLITYDVDAQIEKISSIASDIEGLVPDIYGWIPSQYDDGGFSLDPKNAQQHIEDIERNVIAREESERLARSMADLGPSPIAQMEVKIEPPQPPPNFEAEQIEEIQNTRPRFVIHDADYALQEQKPIEWIVDSIISAGSVNLFVGKEKIGKTYALIHMAVCCALGKPWLGYDTQQCTILFVDEESGERRMRRRLAEVIRGEFGDKNTPFKFISLARINLNDGAEAVLLQSIIEETGARFIVLDALVDIMPGGDENAVKDVHPIFMRLRNIAEDTNSAIIVIHHANKAGDYRGSSAMSGAVDLLMKVDRQENTPIIRFKLDRVRDVEPFQFSGIGHWSDGQFWLSQADEIANKQRTSPSEDYVIRVLTEQGAMSVPDIQARADTCSPDAAKRAVYSLARREIIYRTNPGESGQGVQAIYAIKETGDDLEF